MPFASEPALRAEVITACRVLTHFRIAEGFGHVSVRVPGTERILITPRKALALVTEPELVEIDGDGRKLAGDGDPPLETAMHVAVYRCRGHAFLDGVPLFVLLPHRLTLAPRNASCSRMGTRRGNL